METGASKTAHNQMIASSKCSQENVAVQKIFTSRLVLSILSIGIGSSFLFGYHIGCVNSSKTVLISFINESFIGNGYLPSDEKLSLIWALVVSAFPFGAIFGSIVAASLADKLGRRATIWCNSIPAGLAAILMVIAYYLNKWYLLLVGRIVVGINAGISSMVATTLIVELAPDKFRDSAGSCHQLFISIGVFISNVFAFEQIFGAANAWQFIFWFTFIPLKLQLMLIKSTPESPRYTAVFKGDQAKALDDLIKLRESREVAAAEMVNIMKEATQKETSVRVGMLNLFTTELRWPTVLLLFLMFMQQMSGINATMYYSSYIFQNAGFKNDEVTSANCAIMIANVIFTAASTYLVDHRWFGRRTLLLGGILGMFTSSVAVVVSLVLIEKRIAEFACQISAIFFMVMFVISFVAGPGSIPRFYVNELFSSNARASANSLACTVNWTTNFAVGLLFPIVREWISNYTFLVFSTSLFFSGLIVFLFVPETKGKSLQMVQQEIKKNRPSCF